MGYYQGDYYTGDYYTGDPGILSFLGRVGKAAVGFIPGIGPVASKAATVVGQVLRKPGVKAGAQIVGGALATVGAERLTAPRGVPLMTPMPGGSVPMLGAGGGMVPAGMAGLRGFHMSKPRKCGGMIIPSHLVKNRHMRVGNVKALRRSIRRANGFARLAKKVLHFTSPRAPRGRAIFKKRKTRRV